LALRRAGSRWSKPSVSHFSLEREALLRSFMFCNIDFLVSLPLREKTFPLFMLSGWSSILIASLMMRSMSSVFVARILVS